MQIYQFLDAIDPTLTEAQRKATDRLFYWDAASQSVKSVLKSSFAGQAQGLSAWQFKTGNYTAVSGDRIIADTSSGSWQLSLPSSPSTGNEISVIGLGTNINHLNIPITKFNGTTVTKLQVKSNLKVGKLIYVNSAIGWIEDPVSCFVVVYLQDSFTDTNNKALTAHTMDIGSGWATSDTNWKISNNRAVAGSATGNGTAVLANSGYSNVSAQANISWANLGVNSQQGLILRGIDSSNYLLLRYVFPAGNFRITQTVNGTQTDLATASISVSSGSTGLLRFNANENVLTGHLNGNQIITATSTTLSTATKCGLWAFEQGSGTGASWDNFLVQSAT